MHSFSLPMLGHQRPVIKLYGSKTLIDTGALIPMTNFSPEVLCRAWNAKLVMKDASIGGIGGRREGSVYTLHDFNIGDLHFKKMDIFVPNVPDFTASFLLSATLFQGLDISFDMTDIESQSFTVNIPDGVSLNRSFEIKELNGTLYAQIDGVLLQEPELFHHIDNYTFGDNPSEMEI